MQSPNDPSWRARTRAVAAILFAAGAALIAMNAASLLGGRRSASALGLLFAPPMVLLAGGALVQPPLLYVFGPRRPSLTPGERRAGTALGIVGLVIGLASSIIWFVST